MSDERVSKTYRSVATERAPEHLDKAVLAEAARVVKPRYSRLTAWTRPLAWAATIMLSVALVLELTRAPVPEAVTPVTQPVAEAVSPATPPALPGSEATRQNTEQLPAAVELKAEPEAALDDNLDSFTEAEPRRDLAAPAPPGERRERAFEADAFAVSDSDMRQQAEEIERLQEGMVSADAPLGRSAAVASGVAMPDCDESDTADPESWLACIENLEAAGFDDEAARQRELLAERHPEFDSH